MGGGRLRLLLYDGEGGRPALTPALVERLLRALEEARDAALVTIEGAPDAFCAGLDLSGEGASEAQVARFAALLQAIERAPCPVLALVDGPAQGGGVGIAAAADLVIASPRASFALPETLLGLIPAAVFPVVARRTGVPRARLLALGAPAISAAEALRVGLADEVALDPEAALARHAARFARMDRRAIAAVKALAAAHFAAPPGYGADAAARFRDLFASAPTRERLARFAAGDPPWAEAAP